MEGIWDIETAGCRILLLQRAEMSLYKGRRSGDHTQPRLVCHVPFAQYCHDVGLVCTQTGLQIGSQCTWGRAVSQAFPIDPKFDVQPVEARDQYVWRRDGFHTISVARSHDSLTLCCESWLKGLSVRRAGTATGTAGLPLKRHLLFCGLVHGCGISDLPFLAVAPRRYDGEIGMQFGVDLQQISGELGDGGFVKEGERLDIPVELL